MKKLLALLIIIAMALSITAFAACDGNGEKTVPNPVNPDGTLNLGQRQQELTIDEIEDLFEEWDDFVSEGNLGTFAMTMNFRSFYEESDDFSFEVSFTARAVNDGTNSYSVMESTEDIEDGELKMVARLYLYNDTAFEQIIITLDGEEVENSRFVIFIEELEDITTEYFDLSDLLEMLEDDEYVEFEAASYANGTRIIITDKFESDTLTESAEAVIVFDNNGRLVFLSIDESRDSEEHGISEFEMTMIITWGGNLTVARPNAALFTAIPAADDITIDIIVTWSPEEDSFAVGDTIDLEAVFEFGDLEEGHWSWEEVTWSVNNNNASIMTSPTHPWVSLQLVNAGTVTITATSRIDSNVYATFTITILEEHGDTDTDDDNGIED